MDIKELEKRISNIEKRNQKVEQDKKWETSLIRRILLITFTYFSIAFYMNAIKVINPWLNAVIPSIGFLAINLNPVFLQKTLD